MSTPKLLNKLEKMSKILQVFAGAFVLSISIFLAHSASAGTLSCSITTAADCTGGTNTIVLRMSGTSETNAHAELASGSVYTNKVVCCSGVAGLGTSCSGTNATVLRLSGASGSNAHVEEKTLTNANYSTSLACLSVPSEGTVSTGYTSTGTCAAAGFDTAIGSMSNTTNAHIGTSTAYTNKICASATGGVANKAISGTVTSSVFDSTGGAIGGGYHSMFWKGTLGAGGTGKVRFQFAGADATTGPWNYIGGFTCQVGDWFTPSGPDTVIELIGTGASAPTCRAAWNNKRYFRYKVQLCSGDCVAAGPNTPTITGIVVNWGQ